MKVISKPAKHLYSHDVHLERVGLLDRERVTCRSPECNSASVFHSVTMTQDQWVEILNEFYKKHRTFCVKNDGRVRVPEQQSDTEREL